jgi:hypothetical protein
MGHMSPQTYRILKFVVGKFRLKSVQTEGSVVRNLGVLCWFFLGGWDEGIIIELWESPNWLSMPLVVTLYGCYNITILLNVQAVNYLWKFLRGNVTDPHSVWPDLGRKPDQMLVPIYCFIMMEHFCQSLPHGMYICNINTCN